MKAYVCRTCSTDGKFVEDMRKGLAGVDVEGVDCMSGCTRAQTVAFREAGKVAYLFGNLTKADIADLQNFVRRYEVSPDGIFEDARVLGGLRHKAIARIPG